MGLLGLFEGAFWQYWQSDYQWCYQRNHFLFYRSLVVTAVIYFMILQVQQLLGTTFGVFSWFRRNMWRHVLGEQTGFPIRERNFVWISVVCEIWCRRDIWQTTDTTLLLCFKIWWIIPLEVGLEYTLEVVLSSCLCHIRGGGYVMSSWNTAYLCTLWCQSFKCRLPIFSNTLMVLKRSLWCSLLLTAFKSKSWLETPKTTPSALGTSTPT